MWVWAGAMMGVLGVLALAVGLALLIAEAHVSSAGVLAGLGALAASIGLALLIVASGAGLLVAVPLAVAGAGAAIAAALVAVPRVRAARRAPVQAGPQRLPGSAAKVHSWHGQEGQVEADGGLWRARLAYPGADQDAPAPGEVVIVQEIRGLTLAVRRREPWEVEPS
jgi:membrane-bound serine protease (ClpP class)